MDGFLGVLTMRVDEVGLLGLRGPEGEVAVVDGLHRRRGVDAVLLGGEVVGEGERREVARGGEGDAHRCGRLSRGNCCFLTGVGLPCAVDGVDGSFDA